MCDNVECSWVRGPCFLPIASKLSGEIDMEFAPWHWLVVLGVAVLLFGGKKLPELGKGMGEGLRGFKEGMKGITGNSNDDEEARRKEAEAKAYAEAKAAAEARLAAEQKVAAEQKEVARS